MKYLMFLAIPLLLSACEQRYRYPCQDPANWELNICKKPLCEVNKDCPEYIFKTQPAVEPPKAMTPRKGECN